MSGRSVALYTCFWIAACGSGKDGAALLQVMPGEGAYGNSTPVRIVGRHLAPAWDGRFDSSRATVDADYHALLGGVELADVQWESTGALRATVPAELPPATYALEVLTPAGEHLLLANAFVVQQDAAQAPPGAQLSVTGVLPSVLTANGSDSATISVHVQEMDGTPILAARLLGSVIDGGGALLAQQELGAGDYTFTYQAPAVAELSEAHVRISFGELSVKASIGLVPSCSGADFVVNSATELELAVSSAKNNDVHDDICVTAGATISLTQTLLIDDPRGLTLHGEVGATLKGDSLPLAAYGLELSGPDNRIADLSFVGFVAPLYISGARNQVEGCTFSGAQQAVEIVGDECLLGPGNIVKASTDVGFLVGGSDALVLGNVFADNSGTALRLANSATIKRNVLSHNTLGISLVSGEQTNVDQNTFFGGNNALLVASAAQEVLVRNNVFDGSTTAAISAELGAELGVSYNLFFANGVDCQDCVLGEGSVFADPLFVDADAGDFHPQTDPPSPCIDAGVHLGDFYLGQRPDMGAFEVR